MRVFTRLILAIVILAALLIGLLLLAAAQTIGGKAGAESSFHGVSPRGEIDVDGSNVDSDNILLNT